MAAHNSLRKKHKAPSLTKSKEVAKLAQDATDKCAELGELKHTFHSYKGASTCQNLVFIYDLSVYTSSPDIIIKKWYYDEEPHYDYNKGTSKDGEVVWHFTAMVWKSNKEIGCAYTPGKWKNGKGFYIACEYYPAGNVAREYTKNVVKPSS